MRVFLTRAVLAILVVAGCDRSAASGTDSGTADASAVARVASCDRSAATGTCSEYDAAYLAQNENLLTASCAKLGGTFVSSECPNTSVLGACKMSTSERRKFYATGSAAYDADRARKECESTFHGVWQPH